MDLDARQARNFFQAGTVTFPTPFPSTGTISLDVGKWTYSVGASKDKDVILVQEFRGNCTIVRLILRNDVSAIFIPGVKANGKFRISRKPYVANFDKGEWFLNDDIKEDVIRKRLDLDPKDDIRSRNSILRGIVYVPEEKRILRITETATTAGADEYILECPCSCCRPGCTCCWGGCTCCYLGCTSCHVKRTYQWGGCTCRYEPYTS